MSRPIYGRDHVRAELEYLRSVVDALIEAHEADDYADVYWLFIRLHELERGLLDRHLRTIRALMLMGAGADDD